MASASSQELRERLVARLRRSGHVRSDRVAAAFSAVPREGFVPDLAAAQGLEAVYRDEALPAKVDARGRWLSSSSQPSLMALMLEQLAVEPGQNVLEVGAGTGYNAALLRQLVGPQGRVTTIDVDPALARRARAALRRAGVAACVLAGDGREGHAVGAPYDRIVVTASAAAIPNAWLEQLGPAGRLELPLRLGSEAVPQVIPVLERRGRGAEAVAMTWGGFMPLHGGDGGQQGPPPGVFASRLAHGEHRSLVQVSGPGVERLSDEGRRRVLALLLAGPRTSRRGGSILVAWPEPPGLLLHLLTRVPATRRIEARAPGRTAIGAVAPGGRGAALVSFADRHVAREAPPEELGRARREAWRLETYGEDPPDLDPLLAEWRSVRRGRVRIRVRPSRRGPHAAVTLGYS